MARGAPAPVPPPPRPTCGQPGIAWPSESVTIRSVMALEFQPFDPRKPVRIYRRNLPHWRQDGATYFVTWRLADSLPAAQVRYLRQLRDAMVETPADDDPSLAWEREYFRSMERFLDAGHGSCVLRRPDLRGVVEACMRRFDGVRYQLGEHVVMPNHVHALVRPLGDLKLETVIGRWKSFTTREANRRTRGSGSLWQEEFHDRIVRDAAELERTIRYILNNPRPPGRRIMPWEDR